MGKAFETVSSKPKKLQLAGLKTAQSSQGWGGKSSRAIDGSVNGKYPSGTCTHTQKQKGWWKVDLGTKKHVTKVVIWNRTDCCQNRLLNTRVFAGSKMCGAIHSGKRRHSINCGGKAASYIAVRRASVGYLTLCEVQVYAY